MRSLLLLATAVATVSAAAINPRDAPEHATGVKVIRSPNGSRIRYKEPGKEGICETTPGVNSYSGYIDIDDDVSVFFWFFESQRDPKNDPVTLWLNGGPGSDSLIGLFEELGPCTVTENITTVLRDHSWSQVSNLLFLSQPVGTGFSYSTKEVGALDPTYLTVEPMSDKSQQGRWSIIEPTDIDTSRLAAASAWELLQAFYTALPTLDPEVGSVDFHLWTESFGGHWGPSFSTHFIEENDKLDNDGKKGVKLNFKSLGIVNGIIDEPTQTKYLLEFTHKNTYGVKLINDTVYDHGKFNMGICQGNLDWCKDLTRENSIVRRSACSAAQFICQATVEGLYYTFGNRGTYDIRAVSGKDVPPAYWRDYLNTAPVQQAIGVELNYTSSNLIYTAFSLSGDFAAPYLPDLEELLEKDIHVALMYGDADYICNWLGGEAISKVAKWSGQEAFNNAGYTNLMVDGVAYGETRQYGKLSFTRVWEAGHEVPYFQPAASLQIFNRTINNFDIATGQIKVFPNSSYATNGTAETTHTTTLPPLPHATPA
ncbi:Alpha/Beta hydrolase protein [Penicillium cf. viridicatum]|uniref:Alpha/Beta hydrolase protein n=1 Tax=Penicillium cf. viridicatum TaxID=2972119 RepID=A0A9W9SZ01_9EURO|nr:Alpha/Beta hydrolase protein [Penicillium cf. viridicatum]